jgi:ketosteroid isomerase-like protein
LASSLARMRRAVLFALSLSVPVLFAACGGNEAPPPVAPAPVDTTPPAPTPPPPAETAKAPDPPKPSLAELQKTALMSAAMALNSHDAKGVAAAYADDALISVAGLNDLSGKAQIQSNMQEWFDTFSKVKVGWSRVWTKNDVMVLEWVLNGTHTGELFGVKGTDQPIGHLGLSILTFDQDGHVKAEHRYGDLGTVMAQVTGKGAKPIPQVPAAPEMIPSTGAPDEDAKVEVVKSVYASLEKKSEADFLGKLSDDIEYEGHLGSVKRKPDAKKFFATFTKAFPDAKFEVASSWGFGDYAIVEYTLRATHKAPILGLAATNRKVIVHAVDVYKTKDGKVVKAQTYSNGLELLNQLGPGNDVKLQATPASAAPKK